MKIKTLFILAFLFLAAAPVARAVDQDPDTLIWDGRRYLLVVEWNTPSVMQVYYQRTASASPFHTWSSNNNRGHIATFELREDKLYLLNIEAKRYRTRDGNLWTETGIDTVASPYYFGIHSLFASQPYDEDAVLADWFSGIVTMRYIPQGRKDKRTSSENGTRYLHIRYGKVVSNILISDKEKSQLEKPDYVATSKEMKDRKAMLDLQNRYMSVFIRCVADREQVTMNGHEGVFERSETSLNLIMSQFENDPLMAPNNWEQPGFAGAPIGSWLLRNDSLFLVSIEEHNGTEPYTFQTHHATFGDYFPDREATGELLFADWLSGDYVIQYGTHSVDDYGVPEYTVYKTQRIRLKKGEVLSSKFTPRGFDEDDSVATADAFAPCSGDIPWSVDDKQLAEAVGQFKAPKKNPVYEGGKNALRNYFLNKPLTDERVKDRLFRVRIGFMVNCNGETGQWQVINKSRGELNEFANMVLEVVRTLPAKWEPAEDKKGNKVDCWQILEFTVSNGVLTNGNYK